VTAGVTEGDTPVRYQMPVSVSGHGTGTLRVFAQNRSTGASTVRLVTVKRGARHIDIPVLTRGDLAYSYDDDYTVLAEAVHGNVVGGYQGNLQVQEMFGFG